LDTAQSNEQSSDVVDKHVVSSCRQVPIDCYWTSPARCLEPVRNDALSACKALAWAICIGNPGDDGVARVRVKKRLHREFSPTIGIARVRVGAFGVRGGSCAVDSPARTEEHDAWRGAVASDLLD